eukprot:1762482-Amphidinium_carterae.2
MSVRIYYYNDDVEPIRIALHLSQPFRIEVYQDGVLLDEATHDTSQCCGTPRYPSREDASLHDELTCHDFTLHVLTSPRA